LPLFADGLKRIRRNLQLIQAGEVRPPLEKIGYFTPEQLEALNAMRRDKNFEPLNGEVVFRGKHLHDSRCVENGYTIDEILEQIQAAFTADATVHYTVKLTALRSRLRRSDRDGIMVIDEAVFECTGKYPRAELFSIIPRGDGRKIQK
jgi:hypothetical protein